MANKATLTERYLAAKRALFDRAYSALNDRQREAVFTTEGPLLVLAGAGSGKTTVLVKRITFIIKYGNAYFSDKVPDGINEERVAALEAAAEMSPEDVSGILPEFISSPCPPWAMLAITFTNKAANEIKSRLADAFAGEGAADEIWAGTFHSVCMRILRRDGEKVGLRRGFSVYDTDDSKRVIAECMKELEIDDKLLPVKTVMNAISRAKDKLKTPEQYTAEADGGTKYRQIAEVYEKYQAKLVAANAVDFDDIINYTVRLFEGDKETLKYYQSKFKYISIDEYQDTNVAQFRLAQLLAGKHRNIMVVGDDDQSIYKFRGATIENILGFDKVFNDAKVIKLEQNYRSTSTILEAANAVIRNNFGRRGKELWTDADKGEPIMLRKLPNQNDEARFIINKIVDTVIREKRKYRDFAVLYRMNAQSSGLEGVFAKSGVPYRIFGGLRFFDRKEVRDIVAYLHLISNHDDNLRLKRIINEPKRKIGAATVEAVELIATEENTTMFDIARHAADYLAISKSANKLGDFARLIERLAAASEEMSVHDLINKVIDDTGYRQMLVDEGDEAKDRLDNLSELVSTAIEYEERSPEPSLQGYLEDVALVADIDKYDEGADAVVLMTVHSAKGLEFPIVILPGMEDGIFPGMQSTFSPDELEEERRLAYVAITRAREKVIITHTKERLLYGKHSYNPLSRFIGEIPEELLDSESIGEPQVSEIPAAPDDGKPARKKNVMSKEFFTKSSIESGVGRTNTSDRFAVGDRVSHLVFGKGSILSAREMGADLLYEIAFDNVGTKKLMATYAKLRPAE